MAPDSIEVKFSPHGQRVGVLPGTTLIEAAAQAGLTLDTPCGGGGQCGKCRVRVVSGEVPMTSADLRVFSKEELMYGWRLGCQAVVTPGAPLEVEVPESSLFAGRHRILETSTTGDVEDLQPVVRKIYVELTPPTLEDGLSDRARLEEAIGKCEVDLELLRVLPGRLREWGFRGTAVCADRHLIDLEAGDTTKTGYAVALDIGTTTLVGVLLDLASGDECAVASCMNPQVTFGDDVLSRIAHASSGPDALEELRLIIIDEIDALVGALCQESSVERHHIYEVVFAGNTTMEHLLCGIDPRTLGQVPFVPVFSRGLTFEARELGITIHPRGRAYVFPVIGGFVGGDTVACMLSTQLTRLGGPSLLIDLGTNGEIVLTHEGHAWAASTAAGPAFEGARISCGMRATQGAIEKAVLDDDFECSVIGNTTPRGLCGSGLIDVCAQLLGKGLLTPDGQLLAPDQLPVGLSNLVRERVRRNGSGGIAFVLHEAPGAALVTLTQQDIRELQLACGAIRAGIAILLRQAGLEVEDLAQALIAGGFGTFVRRNHAQQIGLLPQGIPHHRIHYVGNASLGGAKWAALSRQSRSEAEDLARTTVHVELSTDPDFATEFAMAMRFPEPVSQQCGIVRR